MNSVFVERERGKILIKNISYDGLELDFVPFLLLAFTIFLMRRKKANGIFSPLLCDMLNNNGNFHI